jgi:hypothetical protein
VKPPVTIPTETPQVGAVISPVEGPVAVIVHAPVSDELKKLPLTDTKDPLTPLGGDSEIVGAPWGCTVNEAVAVSPLLPVTVTVYDPGDTFGPTVKLPVTIPTETPQLGVGTVPISPVEGPLAVIAQVKSDELKKLPLTETTVPLLPFGGDSEIVRVPWRGTKNEAIAESLA